MPQRQPSPLAPKSQHAIDAFFDSGSSPYQSPESSRLHALLQLLDSPPADSASKSLLVDVTMARVLRAAERDLAGRIHPTGQPPALAQDSASMVDTLARQGWRGQSGPVASLLSLLSPRHNHSDRQRLIDSTLDKVQGQIESTRTRFRLSPERDPASARPAFRFRDFAAAAAAIVLLASLLFPMLSASRTQTQDALCAANLSRAALGFSLYAADHKNRLPQTQASFLGGTWWDVGRQNRSHSANLYLLVKGGYASLIDLSCPGNAAAPTIDHDDHNANDWRTAEEVSFSYQLPGPARQGWNTGSRFVVLADKSPVIRRSRLREIADPLESSRNHSGRGQNILFADASIRFHATPVLPTGDNIWLPGSTNPAKPLTGREVPTNDTDAFVGP